MLKIGDRVRLANSLITTIFTVERVLYRYDCNNQPNYNLSTFTDILFRESELIQVGEESEYLVLTSSELFYLQNTIRASMIILPINSTHYAHMASINEKVYDLIHKKENK